MGGFGGSSGRIAKPRPASPAEPERAEIGDGWIGIEQAARYLAVPIRTLYRLAERQTVPAVKVGRTWRFKQSLLDAHLVGQLSPEGRERGETAAPPSPAPGSAGRGRSTTAGSPAVPVVRDVRAAAPAAGPAASADLSAELAALADPPAIARYLDGRLPPLFHVDVAALLRLDGTDLVTLASCDSLGLPMGTRFTLAPDAPLLGALRSDDSWIIEDVARAQAGTADRLRAHGLRSAACVPVRLGGTVWGVLALGACAPRQIRANDVDRLRSIASQAGLALHNVRLFGETIRWSEQLERIEQLSRLLNRSRAVTAVADAVASQIDSVIDWHGLRFYLLAPDGITLEPIKLACKVEHYAHHTPDLVRLQVGQGLGGHIAQAGVAEIINDAVHDPRTRQIPGTPAIDESMIVVPLRYEDALLGIIELFRLGRDAFDATDLRLAQIVGAQASVAIVNAKQLEELERGSAALERRLASQRQLLAITERLLLHRESGSIFDAIADTLAEVVPHDTLTIYLVDREAGYLIPTLARDQYAEQILASRPALGEGITGDVLAKGEAEVINDAVHDPRQVQVPGTPVEQTESMIVAPIRTSEGVIGALNLYRANHEFDADDLELVRLFTNHVAIALENATIHDRLIEAALTDPLTGLPNRRLFTDRVNHALLSGARTGTDVAVLFLDLDGFKLVNDSLGHAAGDEVLAAVGMRLRTCIRAGDTVARLGGDEFAILLEDLDGVTEALAAGERVLAALADPLVLPARTVSVRASIGVALGRDEVGVTAVDLLRNADTAMYQAKGRHTRLELFEPGMHARQVARLELENELREALALGQFRLVYQPIVALATGRIAGAEALLRWDRPAGAVSPQEFIPLAEETGDIVPLGSWVLAEACRQARQWQSRYDIDDFGISVNISARQLAEARFVNEIEAILAETALAPHHLTLEITESVMLADETSAIATLRRLRAAGIHIAVDDFGTGYSSLSYLNRLPVDELKIDRSFVQGLGPGVEKGAIVSATLSFARALSLEVTAEGVETDAQLRRLRDLGCPRGQGYHFSVPIGPEEMAALIASRRPYRVTNRRRSRRSPRAA